MTNTGENLVTFGLKDLVIFFHADAELENPGIYIDSIVNYKRSMNVTTSDLHANDRLYFRHRDEKNGDGTMELANLPKAVLARMLGWRIDSKGGLVHMKDAVPERFDMCYSVSGDKYERRKFIYGCEASITQDENETRGENVNFRLEQASITEFGVDANGEHVWEYTIYEADDPTGFEASMTQVVYPQPEETTANADPDTTLSALSIGSLTLDPAFAAGTTAYAATTSNATNTVTATPADEDAIAVIRVNGAVVESGESATWEEGENTVIVTVINGTAASSYTVAVTKSE